MSIHSVRRASYLSLAMGLALASFGCGAGAGNDICTTDDDCRPGYFCRAGMGCFTAPMELCEDLDGDGYSRGPGCSSSIEIDCADGDANISPGASEICNDGIDQNCFGGADEACDCTAEGIGTTRDCGVGRCSGIQTCADTGWGECVPLVRPEPEACGADNTGDGIDDDCDGEVDNGCDEFSCPDREDGAGQETICRDDGGQAVMCSSNGTC